MTVPWSYAVHVLATWNTWICSFYFLAMTWHDMLHYSYLYTLFFCMCVTQKNTTASHLCSFFLLPCSSVPFSQAHLSKPLKTIWRRVQHVSSRLPGARSASYKCCWLLKKPKSLDEGGRGKVATDEEHLNNSFSVPCWPQIAGLFGNGLYPLMRLTYNKTINWQVLCSSKIKVTLTSLAAVDD